MSVIYEYLKKLRLNSSKDLQPKISISHSSKRDYFLKNKIFIIVIFLCLISLILFLVLKKFLPKESFYVKKEPAVSDRKFELNKNKPEKSFHKSFIKKLKCELSQKTLSQKLNAKKQPDLKKSPLTLSKVEMGYNVKKKNPLNKDKESKAVIKTKIKKQLKQDRTSSPAYNRFFIQSQKNKNLLDLNKRLKELFTNKKFAELEKELKKVEAILGKDSVIFLKWKGLILFEKGELKEAERIFYTILKKSPLSKDVRINLILTLLALNKKELARKEFLVLKERFPFDKDVIGLKEYFNE